MGRGKERGSDYYDLAYSNSKAYYKLPEEIPEYYDMWMAGAGHVEYVNPRVIVDLGCGAGHFGEIVKRTSADRKINFEEYYGYDFSTVALNMAKEMVKDPRFVFEKQDLYKFDFSKNKPSDSMYVSYEFLEHIEGDLEVLKKIPKGSYISFSVPSFDSKGHVRYFKSKKDIYKRYNSIIDIRSIASFVKAEATEEEPALFLFLCFGIIK